MSAWLWTMWISNDFPCNLKNFKTPVPILYHFPGLGRCLGMDVTAIRVILRRLGTPLPQTGVERSGKACEASWICPPEPGSRRLDWKSQKSRAQSGSIGMHQSLCRGTPARKPIELRRESGCFVYNRQTSTVPFHGSSREVQVRGSSCQGLDRYRNRILKIMCT